MSSSSGQADSELSLCNSAFIYRLQKEKQKVCLPQVGSGASRCAVVRSPCGFVQPHMGMGGDPVCPESEPGVWLCSLLTRSLLFSFALPIEGRGANKPLFRGASALHLAWLVFPGIRSTALSSVISLAETQPR